MDEEKNNKALELLKEENKKNSSLLPAVAVAFLAAAAFPILLLMAASAPPTEEFQRSIMAFAAATVTIIAAYVALRSWNKETPSETAERLDDAARAKNSLETSLELGPLDHPLKHAQLAQTSALYSDFPIRRWSAFIMLAWLAAAIFIVAEIAFVSIQFEFSDTQKRQIRQEKKLKEALKKIAERKNRDQSDYFKIEFVAPEPEKRAKPLDEIEWKGFAESNRGFRELHLALSVNGTPRKNIPVKKFEPNAEGALELNGAFCLDELDVEPFDLVSYNIEGHMDFNGEKNKPVVGIPQFIEVRPFKENAKRLSMGGGGSGNPMYDILIKFLCVQISLNKAAYAIRSSGIPYDDKIMREQIALLENEQRKLQREVDAFLKQNNRSLSVNIMDNMKKAEKNMRDAAKRLEDAVEKAKKEATGK